MKIGGQLACVAVVILRISIIGQHPYYILDHHSLTYIYNINHLAELLVSTGCILIGFSSPMWPWNEAIGMIELEVICSKG